MSLISPHWSQCHFRVKLRSASRTALTALVADVLGADACCTTGSAVRHFDIWVEYGQAEDDQVCQFEFLVYLRRLDKALLLVAFTI